MKRYCVCPVIGSGTAADSYRAAVADVCPTTAKIKSHPVTGLPVFGFAFCVFATDNLPSVLAVTNTYVLPDYPLDGQMSGMEAEARTGLVQSAGAYDLDGQGLHLDLAHEDADGYRDVINRIGKTWDAAFDANTFDVREF